MTFLGQIINRLVIDVAAWLRVKECPHGLPYAVQSATPIPPWGEGATCRPLCDACVGDAVRAHAPEAFRAVCADAVRRALYEDRSAGVQGGLLAPGRLAEIEARAAAAAPGPWSVCVAEASGRCYVDCAAGRLDLDPGRRVASLGNRDGSLASAQFIAAARADIPALLRHVRALELLLADEGFRESMGAAERRGRERGAAEEREACARVVEAGANAAIAEAIRARGGEPR